MTDDVKEAIQQLNTDLEAAARQSELLGSEFDRSEAEATAYAVAIEALASTSADLDAPIGANGESLRDLAETYLALEAEATKSTEAERAARQEREAITAATEGLTSRLRENVQLQALLGGEFDKASADASAYGSAVRSLTAAGVDMDAVVTANGETLRDLADRYVDLTAAAGPANEMQAEGERLTRQFLTPAEELAATQARYNELLDAGAISQETFNRAMAEAEERFREATASLSTLEDGLVRTAVMGIDAFAAFATGAGDAMSRFVKRALSDLARLIARVLIARALLAAFPGSGFVLSLAGTVAPRGLASGGSFRKDEMLLVGEEGPELIAPNFSGQVFSAPDTSRMMAAAGSGAVATPSAAPGDAAGRMFGAGGSLSLDTSSLPPRPRAMTPDAVATDDWWRQAFGHLKLDYDERGGR